jgi:hypothetical protein
METGSCRPLSGCGAVNASGKPLFAQLSYSKERGEGFKNPIVTLLAADLGVEVDYI